ncbi:hypothetical protein F2P81_015599 [Scophthalmus maximus]|uniref:Uncharacterized protein n=1 Tax=Scophthalmus maximus TaxID=52904 RepID=A0A6A4SL37_SCOMX|nr:hypothetical protein F2P81_015599 [Scophthalmus maximus]
MIDSGDGGFPRTHGDHSACFLSNYHRRDPPELERSRFISSKERLVRDPIRCASDSVNQSHVCSWKSLLCDASRIRGSASSDEDGGGNSNRSTWLFRRTRCHRQVLTLLAVIFGQCQLPPPPPPLRAALHLRCFFNTPPCTGRDGQRLFISSDVTTSNRHFAYSQSGFRIPVSLGPLCSSQRDRYEQFHGIDGWCLSGDLHVELYPPGCTCTFTGRQKCQRKN